MNFRPNWSWKPDSNTRTRIKNGNRKVRRPELSPQRVEEMKMRNETTESSVTAAAEDNPKSTRKSTDKKAVRKTVKKVAAKKTVSQSDSNMVPLKSICKQLDVEPRLARRKLRKAKIAGHGERDRWLFRKDSPQLEKAKEALRA